MRSKQIVGTKTLKRLMVLVLSLSLFVSNLVFPTVQASGNTYDLGLAVDDFGEYMTAPNDGVWTVAADDTYTAALQTKNTTDLSTIQLFSKLDQGKFKDFELNFKLYLGSLTEWWHGVDFMVRDSVQVCFHQDGYITLYGGPSTHENLACGSYRVTENYENTWHDVSISFTGTQIVVTFDSVEVLNHNFGESSFSISETGAIYMKHEAGGAKIADISLTTDLDEIVDPDLQTVSYAASSFIKAVSDCKNVNANLDWTNYSWQAQYTDANTEPGKWHSMLCATSGNGFGYSTDFDISPSIVALSNKKLSIAANRWGTAGYFDLAAVCYVAPGSDVYRVSCDDIAPLSANDLQGGGSIRLTLNNVQIWPSGTAWAAVNHTEETVFEPMDITMQRGDVLRFEVMSGEKGVGNPNGANIRMTLSPKIVSASSADMEEEASVGYPTKASTGLRNAYSDCKGNGQNLNWNNYVWKAQYTDRNHEHSTDKYMNMVYANEDIINGGTVVNSFAYSSAHDIPPSMYVDATNHVIMNANRWGDANYYDMASLSFTAPSSGEYTLSCTTIEPASPNDLLSGGSFRVTLNGETIWPQEGGFATVSHTEKPSITGMDLVLEEFDVIRFEFVGGAIGVGNTNGLNSRVAINPMITRETTSIVTNDEATLIDCEDTSLISGVVAETNCVTAGKVRDDLTTTNLSSMTDGSALTATASSLDLANGTGVYVENSYQTFTFDMGDYSYINKVQVVGDGDPDYYLNVYKIYVGNSKSELFTEDNLYYIYDSSEFGLPTRNQIITFNIPANGRYIGIMVESCCDIYTVGKMVPSISEVVVNGFVLGDCDNDKYVAANDLTTMRRGILDLEILKKSADLNRDSKFSILDLIRLKKVLIQRSQESVINNVTEIAEDPLYVSGEVFYEQYRPQLHYSSKFGWSNDINGLVYYEGEYHLFYQHNPDHNNFGLISWGHAVSTDLIHWEELPVAIPWGDEKVIWSGSCVVDKNDTSGFFNGGSGLVAVFTYADIATGMDQTIGVAYSSDKGRTWTKIPEPVLRNDGETAFRDPKAFWHEESQKWICIVAGGPFRVYSSDNLRDWTMESKIGHLWTECPDFFEMPVEGTDETKWVLGLAGDGYMVGDFDGKTFTPITDKVMFDKSPDRYGAMTYNNMPDGRRVEIDWMGSWTYGGELVNVLPGNGVATIPVEWKLYKEGDTYRIERDFIDEFDALRGDKIFETTSGVLREGSDNPFDGVKASTLDLVARFRPSDTAVVNFAFNTGNNHDVKVSYDAATQTVSIDRTKQFVDVSAMKSVYSGKATVDEDGIVELRIVLDWSGVEVVANEGENLLSTLYFPHPKAKDIEMYVSEGTCEIDQMVAYRMNSFREQ